MGTIFLYENSLSEDDYYDPRLDAALVAYVSINTPIEVSMVSEKKQ